MKQIAIMRKMTQLAEQRRTSGAEAPVFIGFCGPAEEVAEKLSKHGHSEEAKTTKNLHRADS